MLTASQVYWIHFFDKFNDFMVPWGWGLVLTVILCSIGIVIASFNFSSNEYEPIGLIKTRRLAYVLLSICIGVILAYFFFPTGKSAYEMCGVDCNKVKCNLISTEE